MVEVLLKGRTRIENKILRAAKDKRFATVRRYREGIYKDIQTEYVRLQGDLDDWTNQSILATSKEYHALSAEDLLLTENDKKVISFTKFNAKHNQDYIDRIHPFSSEKLAAVNVNLNPKLRQMADLDVTALRTAVVDSFREAQVAGLTPPERWKILQTSVLDYAEDPKSWNFIDKAGRKWERNSYFNLLNRTISATVARDAYNDTLIDEGRDLVQIIGGLSSNSNDGCVKWVGRVVSLTGKTIGFPLLQEYIDDGGHHPFCVHTEVYVSDQFEKTAEVIDEQRGQPAPVVKKPKKNPVVKMANSDKPRA